MPSYGEQPEPTERQWLEGTLPHDPDVHEVPMPPSPFTDLSHGANRRQMENVANFLTSGSDLSVFFDGELIAVMVPLARWQYLVGNEPPF